MRILPLLNNIKLPIVALMSLLLLWIFTHFFVINISPSMPIGLYIKKSPSNIKQGDMVIACLPESLARSAYNAGIIHKSPVCAHGYQPLLKQMIATAHDVVVSDHQTIMVNDKHYIAPINTNRAVLNTRGTSDFKKNGVWLYGAGYPQNSWDSRYFGALDESNIQSAVRALWVKQSRINKDSSNKHVEANYV